MEFINKYKLITRAWRYRLFIEKWEIKFLINNLKSNQVGVDIGAHKGGYTYWMSKLVGENGKVFSFEPQPQLYNHLKNTIIYSGYKNIVLSDLGFSRNIGTRQLIIPNGGTSPSASVVKEKKENDMSIAIKTTTLDDFFINKHKTQVDFIKCDVEGHELEVFKGGENFFENSRPTVLVESEARHCGEEKVLELFQFMESMDYRGYFHNGDRLVDIDRFNIYESQLNPKRLKYVNNFFFISKF